MNVCRADWFRFLHNVLDMVGESRPVSFTVVSVCVSVLYESEFCVCVECNDDR